MSSVSSGYANDPLAFHTTRSGRTIWMYPVARQRYEAWYEQQYGHTPREFRFSLAAPPVPAIGEERQG